MNVITVTKLTALCIIALLIFAGCDQQQGMSGRNEGQTNAQPRATNTLASQEEALRAVANLKPTQGNEAQGTVTFAKVEDGVRVVADITGLTPGEHGFHIHEHGDCSAPDASSAGGHFNPTGMPHGGPDAAQHHLGDLGNITANPTGKAHLDRVFSFLELSGPNSIVGRGLVVHSGRDDLTSQPSGDAGARVACARIELKE